MVSAATDNTRFMHQLAALVIALALFCLTWISAAILIQALDLMRGLDKGWLHSILNYFIIPWIGGFLGVAVGLRWFKRSSAGFLFFSFAIAIAVIALVYLATVEFPLQNGGMSASTYLWLLAPLSACIFGAYNAAHNAGFFRQ